MSGEYGLGDVVSGQMLPLRARPGDPDTLGPEFASALDDSMKDPTIVSPPEQWTRRMGSFAEALRRTDPVQVEKMAKEALIAPVRRRSRLKRGKLDG